MTWWDQVVAFRNNGVFGNHDMNRMRPPFPSLMKVALIIRDYCFFLLVQNVGCRFCVVWVHVVVSPWPALPSSSRRNTKIPPYTQLFTKHHISSVSPPPAPNSLTDSQVQVPSPATRHAARELARHIQLRLTYYKFGRKDFILFWLIHMQWARTRVLYSAVRVAL